ncbi:urease accessory protein UreF [Amphritea sp. HPY]|uniref:urease accessory protein UreF n=1 Tax=Amphritea sp. HPY TaxID=3421652 RepID=UPI003D7CC04E
MDITTTDYSLIRLLQLSSASLPVGGYAFSQGLEYAIDRCWVNSADQVTEWLSLQLMQSIARVDLPILQRTMQAVVEQDLPALYHYNDLVLACRETKELRLSDTAMGDALARLMRNQDIKLPFATGEEISFVTLFALAACRWQINFRPAALGFTWSWLENQISAATKLVPLGQTQAQRLLTELQPVLLQALALSDTVRDEDIGSCLPALAIASARHETQYSRLFRS